MRLQRQPSPAEAALFQFTYDGYFTSLDTLGPVGGTAVPFADGQRFSATALFDTASPNLVAPIGQPGFVDYAPSSLSLTVGGVSYAVTPYNAVTSPTGLTVAIFDATTPFGPPFAAGHYAAGFIQNPLADGAGIVGDWFTATPPFSAQALTNASLSASQFQGVGISSGVCISGTGANCQASAITPIPLTAGGQSYLLTLSSNGVPQDITYTASGTPLQQQQQSAALTAIPEPASILLLAPAVWLAGKRRRAEGIT